MAEAEDPAIKYQWISLSALILLFAIALRFTELASVQKGLGPQVRSVVLSVISLCSLILG